MKRIINYLSMTSEVIFFVFAFIVWTTIMCISNSKEGADFSWHDLKVEANGMIFDLFVFGILVTIYNNLRARKEKIEHYLDEIDDFRGWDEKEAMHRIAGILRRLNKLNVYEIDLENCFLANSYLHGINLSYSILLFSDFTKAKLPKSNLSYTRAEYVDFTEAVLVKANFSYAELSHSVFTKANLLEALLCEANFFEACLKGANISRGNLFRATFDCADLSDSDLSYSDLRMASFGGANLRGTNLIGVNLEGASLNNTDLLGAKVEQDWFKKIKVWKVRGSEEICLKYSIDKKGHLIENLKKK